MNIDIDPFCSSSKNRRNLWMPFDDGEYTYATDGIIIIRVPGVLEPGERDSNLGAPPNAAAIFELNKAFAVEDGSFGPLPGLPADAGDDITCPDCAGSGVTTCPTCDHNETCERCEGAGEVEDPRLMEVVPGWYARLHYLDKVAQLPGACISVSALPRGAKTSLPGVLWFRCEAGGLGILFLKHQPDNKSLIWPPRD